MHFICNICGTRNSFSQEQNQRVPGPICSRCRSSVRFRKIACVLARDIFGGPEALHRHKPNRLHGVGLSDASPYARVLARYPHYTNTFYHQEPRLDVTRGSDAYRDLDYVISSDVFEHTPPPAETPFHVVHGMLKEGGKLLLSVPATPRYTEHFPELHDFELVRSGDDYILSNVTRDGHKQEFRNLRFHGGPGSTLEMRIYSIDAVEENLRRAGFSSWRVIDQEWPEFGISNITGLSTVWLASK